MQNKKERFVFIDALRGIAALGVLYHHMLHNSVMEVTLRRVMPRWAIFISDYGNYTVYIFFVISGFVIAHSLRHSRLDRASILDFIVRRQIRLDPPYWAAIAMALIYQAIRLRIPALVTSPLPSRGEVLINMVYLQYLANSALILSVAWTLCIEIQFYLVFILLLTCARRWRSDQHAVAAWLVLATGCLSLSAIFHHNFSAWFIQYWYFFAAGVTCCWALQGKTSHRMFYGFALAFLVGSILAFADHHLPPNTNVPGSPISTIAMLTGLATVLLIYSLGRANRLTTLWGNPVLQYLGRISYSLYLVHMTVCVGVLSLGYKLTSTNQRMALVWLVLSGLASLAAAHLWFVTIERPCMQFATKIRRQRESSPPVHLEPAAN